MFLSPIGQVEGLSSHYELVLTRVSGMDRMCVRAEAREQATPERCAELARLTGQRIQDLLKVRLEVEVVPPGTLPRYELKTRRIVDQRPREVRRILDRG